MFGLDVAAEVWSKFWDFETWKFEILSKLQFGSNKPANCWLNIEYDDDETDVVVSKNGDDDDNSGIVSGQGATPIAGRVLISSQSWPASRWW